MAESVLSILVNDLVPIFAVAAVGFVLARVFHVDGTRSVKAAFTPAEAALLAAKAGLHGARVTTHWPQRWLLAWSRT